MLSDEQLVQRLRSELAPLRPRVDLAEHVRDQARADTPPRGSIRVHRRPGRVRLTAGTLVIAASILVVVAVGATLLVLAGHKAQPMPAASPAGGSRAATVPTVASGGTRSAARHTGGRALPSASPSAGPVTCRGGVCRQAGHRVRNPFGSNCDQRSTWVAKTTTPATTYGCVKTPVAGY